MATRLLPWLLLATVLVAPALPRTAAGEDTATTAERPSPPGPSMKPADHAPTQGMPHGLPSTANCNRCHDTANFATIRDDQVHTDGRFPLTGEHGQLPCASCHDVAVGFANLAGECTTCHQARDTHMRLVGDDCSACHTPAGWIPNRFRHTQTGTPLTGAHRGARCDQCHATGFPLVPTDCVYCHEATFRRVAAQHDIDDIMSCDLCHDTHSWGHVRNPHG